MCYVSKMLGRRRGNGAAGFKRGAVFQRNSFWPQTGFNRYNRAGCRLNSLQNFALFVFAVMALTLNGSAATYYVSPTGSDSNTGTQAQPWGSLYHALPLLVAGDTLNILPGTYPEYTHNLTTGASGTPTLPITVKGGVLTGSGIYVGHSNWIFNGVTISNFTSSAHMLGGIVLGPRANGTIVTNCSFRDFTIDQSQYGVVWYPDPAFLGPFTNCTPASCAANCLVIDCLFTNFMGAECIRVGGSNNLITRNTILDQKNGDIFQFFGCSNVISFNYISNAYYRLDVGGGQHADMFQTYGQDGNIPSSGDPFFDSYGNLAENNQFWDCYISFGQMTDDSYGGYSPVTVGDFTLRNNLFVRCGGQDAYAGGSGGSICSVGIRDCKWINNTYVSCFKDTKASGYVIDISYHMGTNNVGAYLGAATNTVIVNNAFIDCGYNTNVAFIGIESGYGFNTNLWNLTCVSNYASWYGTGPSWSKVNPKWQINIKNTPGDNDTYGPPPDINNGDDPRLVLFLNAKWASNLRPLIGSPLIDKGMNAAQWNVTDREGNLRPMGTRFDIGCFEADPNLVGHWDFDEASLSNAKLADVSGYGADAWRFDATNWITSAPGPFGSAGQWTVVGVVTNDPPQVYNLSQYAGVTNVSPFQFITNGTISAWVLWATNGERYDTIFDCGFPPAASISPSASINSWALSYGEPANMAGTMETNGNAFGPTFKVYGNTVTNDLTHPSLCLHFNQPRDGVTWWHLAVTWQGGGNVVAYQNGVPIVTNALGSPWLRVGGDSVPPWLSIGAMQHGGTPQWGDDRYPNSGFFKGRMDDLRIYSRALAAGEVMNLYSRSPVVIPAQPSLPVAPIITAHPQNRTAIVGTAVSFSVGVTGTAPLSYQWRVNGNTIAGATASSYTDMNVQPADAGTYSVVVANAAGSATSIGATLVVQSGSGVSPSITNQPLSLVVAQGGNAQFSVGASGTSPLAYQWLFNGSVVAGASTSTFVRSNVDSLVAGSYSVLVTNSAGTALSASATLSVTEPGLALHLDFDEDFSAGRVVDVSGSQSDGWRLNTTNWITTTAGAYPGTAAKFSYVGSFINNSGQRVPVSQYISVTNVAAFANLTAGCISFWARFDSNSDWAMRLLDNGYSALYAGNPSAASNSWAVCRDGTQNLNFMIYPADGTRQRLVSWPNDVDPNTLSTPAYHLYTVTFNCLNQTAIAYYDGAPFMTNRLTLPSLRVYGCAATPWLAIGAASSDNAPQWGSGSGPSGGYFAGRLDDLRIYTRSLSPAEVRNLYGGQNSQRPSPPTGLIIIASP